MKLSELLYPNEYTADFQADSVEITSLTDHTADILPGCAFLCTPGKHFDPRLMLPHLSACGVAAVILERTAGLNLPPKLPCFYVENVAKIASLLWSRYYGEPDKKMQMIGITGTNGKTTTAMMLMHILQKSHLSCGYIGTLGTYINGQAVLQEEKGTMTTPSPRTLYRTLFHFQQQGVKTVIMEVSSHALNQHRTDSIPFQMALFTNLSAEHLDYHKNMEEYYRAKKRLFDQTKLALVQIDDAYGERLVQEVSCQVQTCGIIQHADHTVIDLKDNTMLGSCYTHRTVTTSFSVCLPLPGYFHVYNAQLATGAALALGIPIPVIQNALCTMPPVKGRMEFLNLKEMNIPYSVMIDYAHTPTATEACLKSVSRMPHNRIIVVFGAGGERDQEKRPHMGKIVSEYADMAFITSDNSRGESTCSIIKDILTGIREGFSYRVITDRKKAIETALDAAQAKDIVVLLGKGHETYEWNKNGLRPFSEEKIVLTHIQRTS